jgi:hypothetical protein
MEGAEMERSGLAEANCFIAAYSFINLLIIVINKLN